MYSTLIEVNVTFRIINVIYICIHTISMNLLKKPNYYEVKYSLDTAMKFEEDVLMIHEHEQSGRLKLRSLKVFNSLNFMRDDGV